MEDSFSCPHCKADLSYEVGGNRYSRLMGIEIQGGYDGVSYWSCPECRKIWDRFTGEVKTWPEVIDEPA